MNRRYCAVSCESKLRSAEFLIWSIIFNSTFFVIKSEPNQQLHCDFPVTIHIYLLLYLFWSSWTWQKHIISWYSNAELSCWFSDTRSDFPERVGIAMARLHPVHYIIAVFSFHRVFFGAVLRYLKMLTENWMNVIIITHSINSHLHAEKHRHESDIALWLVNVEWFLLELFLYVTEIIIDFAQTLLQSFSIDFAPCWFFEWLVDSMQCHVHVNITIFNHV